MKKFTIELPETFIVTSRGVECAVDVRALPDAIVMELALHGLTQKIADAASAAAKDLPAGDPKIAENTSAMMDKARDALVAGEWSRRGTGGGVSEETLVQRMIMRQTVKAKFGGKSPEWKKFTGLDDAAQIAKLDEWYAANAEALAPAVATKLAERKAERERKSGLAKAISIKI